MYICLYVYIKNYEAMTKIKQLPNKKSTPSMINVYQPKQCVVVEYIDEEGEGAHDSGCERSEARGSNDSK